MAGGNLHGLNVARHRWLRAGRADAASPCALRRQTEQFDPLVLPGGEWWGKLRNTAGPHKKHRT